MRSHTPKRKRKTERNQKWELEVSRNRSPQWRQPGGVGVSADPAQLKQGGASFPLGAGCLSSLSLRRGLKEAVSVPAKSGAAEGAEEETVSQATQRSQLLPDSGPMSLLEILWPPHPPPL